ANGGVYGNNATDWVNPDGGSRTTISYGEIRHNEGVGDGISLKHKTFLAASLTDTIVSGMPRSGILSVRGGATDAPMLVAAYSRIGAALGTVTVIASHPGASGSVITLTIPTTNTQADMLNDLTISHNYGAELAIFYTAIGQ
ncbi:hypothetical protein AAGW05_17745, partial [Arthrobacter sp. LAPM80]|uniref:hypothetical protein n=1 Tax=Arthrobacter sp. LAPM80 TaxID=3141788 RepID=UPI00398A6BF6